MSDNLYGGMRPVPENTVLDPERGRDHDEGLISRTATYFQFVDKQTGEYVTPLYEQSTAQFWQSVRMKCLVTSLVGRSRNIIQAGYWGVDFLELHFELMEIDGLTGMFLEKDLSWRKGKEYIFWAHTENYAYALQEAAPPYMGVWGTVLVNWQRGHGGCSGAFMVVDRQKPKPFWWVGKQDWQALLAYEEGDEDEDEDEDVEDEDEDDEGEKDTTDDDVDDDDKDDADADGDSDDDDEDDDEDDEDDDDEDKGDNSGKSSGKGKGRDTPRGKPTVAPRRSSRISSSTRQPQPAQDRVTPRTQSLRATTASSTQPKGKARATMPEESHAAGSASPVASGSRRKRASVGQAGPSSRNESTRPAKRVRTASTPDSESPTSVLPQGPPSPAPLSGSESLGAGPSGAGPSALVRHRSPAGTTGQPETGPTSPPRPTTREAQDKDPRPSKRARIGPPPTNSKGKQRAESSEQSAVDVSAPAPVADPVAAPVADPVTDPVPASTPASTPAPPHNSAPSAPTDNQASTESSQPPPKSKVTFQEWQARRDTSKSQQAELRTEKELARRDSTSQKTPPRAPVDSTPEVPVYGPFSPPTSSPLTPLTASTTRPLTQVTPPTPPGSIETRDNGGVGEEQGEVDMSVSSTSGEGATEQDSTVAPESSQEHLDEPSESHSDFVSRVETMLSEATEVLRQTETASPTAPANPAPMPSAAPSRILKLESRLVDAVQQSMEILQRTSGSPTGVGLPRDDTQSGPAPSASAETSQGPAIAGPSTRHESQAPAQGPGDVDEIGNRMSDLDLANRAPVRGGRQVEGRR